MKLGLESFSTRNSGLDSVGVLGLAAELEFGGVLFELSPFQSFHDDDLKKIRHSAEEKGLYLEFGMGSILHQHPMAEKGWQLLADAGYDTSVSDAQIVIDHLHVAKKLGSPILRCVAGDLLSRDEGYDMTLMADQAVAILREACRAAEDLGMKIAMETHADFTVREHVSILARVNNPAYGLTVDGVNFWEERANSGKELHKGLSDVKATVHNGASRAGFVQKLDWVGPDSDKPLLIERREIDVLKAKDLGATLVEWRSVLEAPPGKKSITLTGHHYFGLGLRFIESMDSGGRFFNSDDNPGEAAPSDSRLTPAKWCAYTAKADGKPVTAAIFDFPSNLRYPARMFTLSKHFAYLSATRNEWKEPIVVKAGRWTSATILSSRSSRYAGV